MSQLRARRIVERVDNLVCFHCRYEQHATGVAQGVVLQPNLVMPVGNGPNPYWEALNRVRWKGKLSNGTSYSGVRWLEHIIGHQPIYPDSASYRQSLVLEYTAKMLRHEAKIVAELIYEEVRRDRYPDHPSRQTCFFAAPTIAAARYWNGFFSGTKQWYRVRLTGQAYLANDEYLINDTISLNDLRGWAKKYWNGVPGINPDEDEILFQGTVEVLEKVDLTTSSAP